MISTFQAMASMCLILVLIGPMVYANVLIMPNSLFPVHRFTMRALAEELIRRGHPVTWLEYGLQKSSFALPTGVNEIFWKVTSPDPTINDLYLHRNHSVYSKIWLSGFNDDAERVTAWMASIELCEQVLSTNMEQFKKLVATKYAAVIVDDLYNPCGLLHVGLQKSTFIYWSLSLLRTESAWASQSPSPPSYLPVPGTGFTDELSFLQRFHNIASYFRTLYIHHHLILRKLDNLFQKYFPGQIEKAFHIERNASINFVNTPQVFDFARPYMPRVTFVGALHCRKAEPLTGELGAFVEGASKAGGVILFSSGFNTQWSTAPKNVINAFTSAFTQLPEIRFIWQYNGQKIDDLPSNVFVAEWLPQQDILGNENTRAHITTGGLNSVVESVWHGVPVIGVPLTTSAQDNLLRLSARNVAIVLPKDSWHTETIVKAIQQINKPEFKNEMLVFQDMVTDVPYTELNHSTFWVEFIDRHNEVPHARSGADDLNLLQYFMLDIIAFLFFITILSCIMIYCSLKYSVRFIRNWLNPIASRSPQKKCD